MAGVSRSRIAPPRSTVPFKSDVLLAISGTVLVAVAMKASCEPAAVDAWRPPFWKALSADERAAEWRVTNLLCSLLYERDVKRAVLRLKGQDAPEDVVRAFTDDPIIFRVVVYVFNPRRDDLKVWPKLRQFVRWDKEIRYVLGIGPELVKQGINLHWINSLVRSFQGMWFAQDAQASGDNRDFKTIIAQYREASRPQTEATPEGKRTTHRMPMPGGGCITGVYLDRTDGTKHEEVVWELPKPIPPDVWAEIVDEMLVRHLQQFRSSFGVQETYFSDQAGVTRVMKLIVADELIAERPLHLATKYGPLIARFAKQYVFGAGRCESEDDPSTDPVSPSEREVSHQEAMAALFEVAIAYRQEWGWVPGVLEARMRGTLTGQFRDIGVSRVVREERELVDRVAHSGDATLELVADDDSPSFRGDGGIEGRIQADGELGGAARWDDAAAEGVSVKELLDPLTEPQRRLALLLMRGMRPVDAARTVGTSRVAVSKMIGRMRSILAEVLSRRAK